MTTSDSNTFITPASSVSITLARSHYNNSLRALLQNFYSSTAPNSENILLTGTATTPLNGMLFRSENGRLYIRDSNNQKGNPVYPSFTRVGIGFSVEESLSTANISSYEIGEAFVVVNSNARMYFKSTNAGAIIDVGIPPANSITNTMMKTASVTRDKVSSEIALTSEGQTFTGGTNIFNRNSGQINYTTAALQVRSTSGNVHFGFNADSDSAVDLVHERGTDNLYLVDSDGETRAVFLAKDLRASNAVSAPNIVRGTSPVLASSNIGETVQAYSANVTTLASLGFTNGDILYENSGLKRLPVGSSGQVLTVSGGLPSWSTSTSVTDVSASAMSTSDVEITGIPSTASVIYFAIHDLRLSSSTAWGFQLGTAGSWLTSGYISSSSWDIDNDINSVGGSTNRFYVARSFPSSSAGGLMVLFKIPGTNIWTMTGSIGIAGSSAVYTGGSLNAGATITRIRANTGSTATFTQGTLGVSYVLGS